MKTVVVNGTELQVLNIRFDEAHKGSENYYHDCYVTFEDGKTSRYDASDVTICDHIYLYHGTSTENLDRILKTGLKAPYLTNELKLAHYYASESVDIVGGNEAVLCVEVDKSSLAVDFNSLEEPTSWGCSIWVLEDKVDEMYEKMGELHPEWISDSGCINIPDEMYELSLGIVASCRCIESIGPEKINVEYALNSMGENTHGYNK